MKTDVAFIGGRGLFSNYGGVENAIREITLRLAKKNINIDVYGVKDPLDDVFEIPTKLRSVLIPNWVYQHFGQHGLIFSAVVNTLFIKRPQVVVVFASGPCIFTPLLSFAGLKVITSLRAIDSERDKWGIVSRNILKLGEYFAWKFSHFFTVNSEEMRRRFIAKRPDVVFIANGAEKSSAEDKKILANFHVKQGQYFLFAARFDPVKRLHILLQAHALLSKKDQIPLVVAGGHAKDPEYEKTIKDLANDKVIFTGHLSQTQLAPLMYHCRAFILPSILEGMSNSLLSAMATQRAVIVADVAENRDVIKDELDTLFKVDDVDELKNKMEKLAVDKNYASNLGNRLAQVAQKHYHWDKTSKKFYKLIKPFLKQG